MIEPSFHETTGVGARDLVVTGSTREVAETTAVVGGAVGAVVFGGGSEEDTVELVADWLVVHPATVIRISKYVRFLGLLKVERPVELLGMKGRGVDR